MSCLGRLIAVIAAVCVAGAPLAGRAAEKNPLLGKWTITDAAIAPWTSEAKLPGLGAQGKRNVGLTFLFTAKTVLSKERNLRCRNPAYEMTRFPADALFQSALPEPDQAELALAMGFKPGLVAGVDVNCSAGLFSYHLRPDGRAMFAFNNIIYTMAKR